jgi:hypothetical protein
MFHGCLDYFQDPPLGGRPNTKLGDHGTLNATNCGFILFYHMWGLAWIEIHWNSIWLRTRSHGTSHYTWGSMTTLHDLGGVLGRPLDAFFWSRLLARVWSGPKHPFRIVHEFTMTYSQAHWNSQWSRITLCASNVYVWQISIDVHLQIQRVTWRFQKQKWMSIDIYGFF